MARPLRSYVAPERVRVQARRIAASKLSRRKSASKANISVRAKASAHGRPSK